MDIEIEISSIKSEITTLRDELSKINEEKKKWSSQQKEVYKTISSQLQTIKDHKRLRDSVTHSVRRFKHERDKLNKLIGQKVTEIKKLKDERIQLQKIHHITEDPIKIRKEIEGMDRRIETEAMSFDKEKQLMKLIKQKQKQLSSANVVLEVSKKISVMSKEIDKLKKIAKEKHELIQEKAAESQKHHEALLEAGKELDDKKGDKGEGTNSAFNFQKDVQEVEHKLESKIIHLKTLNDQIRKKKQAKVAEKKQAMEKILKEKEMDVEEKIKKRKKLTTEDLLIFQRDKKD